MNMLRRMLGSSRFVASLATVLAMIASDLLGRPLSEQTVETVLYVLGFFLAGETLRPAGAALPLGLAQIFKKDEPKI